MIFVMASQQANRDNWVRIGKKWLKVTAIKNG